MHPLKHKLKDYDLSYYIMILNLNYLFHWNWILYYISLCQIVSMIGCGKRSKRQLCRLHYQTYTYKTSQDTHLHLILLFSSYEAFDV